MTLTEWIGFGELAIVGLAVPLVRFIVRWMSSMSERMTKAELTLEQQNSEMSEVKQSVRKVEETTSQIAQGVARIEGALQGLKK